MSTTDIVIPATNLVADLEYARAVTNTPERGAQSLLPKAYQGNPANVLIAMGLGQAIGLTPAQALYEIYVVNGRPSPSANLMAALVRRAGHKLRVEGNATSCTATLIRADDPDYPFTATWTMEQARAISGLTTKETWKAYPAAMLRARAISEVVRTGASEVVLGMQYSREEAADFEDARLLPSAQSSARLSAADFTTPVKDEPRLSPALETGEAITDIQRRSLFAAFTAAGFDTDARSAEGRVARLDYLSNILGRPVESTNDLSRVEASAALDALRQDATSEPHDDEEPTDD